MSGTTLGARTSRTTSAKHRDCAALRQHPQLQLPWPQLQEQKELSPATQLNPGHPSGLPVQSGFSPQQGASAPPPNASWHWGALLAFGPQATTFTNLQTPSVHTFSACHELLQTPTHRASGAAHGVPTGTVLGQAGIVGAVPPLPGSDPPLPGPEPPVAGSEPPLPGLDPSGPERSVAVFPPHASALESKVSETRTHRIATTLELI